MISIIIPIYNVEAYILRCLQSVANQTLTEGLECILVDDCGNDNSIAIAEEFVRAYKGAISFTVVHHDRNKGLSAARNTGINNATGEYLYFLDSDDEITPNCMKELSDIANHYSGIDMIQASFVLSPSYMAAVDDLMDKYYIADRGKIKKMILDYMKIPVTAQNRLIKRSLVLDNSLFFREGIIHEDCYWTFFLAKHVCSLYYSSARLYNHHRNPGSITTAINIQKEIFSYKIIIEELSNAIDSFCRGEQKVNVFRILNIVIKNHYFDSKNDKYALFQALYRQCNPIEKVFLYLWYAFDKNISFNKKAFNVCTLLFRIN